MTKVQEPLTIMDNGQPNSRRDLFTSKSGIFISKKLGILIAGIFILSVVSTGIIVYNFATCDTHELSNAQQYQLNSNECSKCPPTPSSEIDSDTGPTESNDNFLPKYELQTTTNIINTASEQLPDTKTRINSGFNVRLPKSMHPETYYIKLTPYIFESNFTFDGEVTITINVTERCKNITFHAAELIIINTELLDGRNQTITVLEHTEDALRQFHILHLDRDLNSGELYILKMKYIGLLNDNLHGFYRSSYTESNNVTKWIATTQFQPTDARRAFPCFDEPALKAKFRISIARPDKMTSISNMPAMGIPEQHSELEHYVWDHYQESLPMSTYLVAFVVSDFSRKSNGIFSVWARPEAIESASYALEVAPKILEFCEKFYNISYPLPKVDMIALPDFNAGAMENWGLLTFRETAMLNDEKVSARVSRARVAAVVAHELVHQWFGNLVTPVWWSDLWLNEGFATYLEYIAVDAVEKSWKSIEQFIINEMQSSFIFDALATSHQISVEVGNPDEINEIFDRISYSKGAAVIRMMNHFLTDEVFLRGITNYLNSRKFANAEQNDLWNALTTEARRSEVFDQNTSVEVIMDTWTLQTGFPVVTITRHYNTGVIDLEQERFVLINGTDKSSREPLWWVPVSYSTRNRPSFDDTRPALWMRGEKKVTWNVANNITDDEWLIANNQQTGFFRVNYDLHNWKMIIKHLNDPEAFTDIVPINRAQLLDDAMNLALAGRLDYRVALNLTKYLAHERSYVPWKAGLVTLGFIDSMFAKGAYYLEYKSYVLSLLDKIFEDVGFESSPDDSMVTVQKRVDILTAACHLGHRHCLVPAVQLFQTWTTIPNPDKMNYISPDVRGAVYCAAVSSGGSREWSFVYDRFRSARVGSERELLLAALGCARAPWLLSRYLEFSIRNDTGIRKQDVFRVFHAVSNSVVGQPIAFAFVRTNWHRLKNYLGATTSNLHAIVKVVTKRFNQPHELMELRKFAKEHRSELGRALDQAIERTEANIQWMHRNYDTILNWLLAPENAVRDNSI